MVCGVEIRGDLRGVVCQKKGLREMVCVGCFEDRVSRGMLKWCV